MDMFRLTVIVQSNNKKQLFDDLDFIYNTLQAKKELAEKYVSRKKSNYFFRLSNEGKENNA